MAEYKISYESEVDAFQLYYRYKNPRRDENWRTAALRGPALPALGNAVAGAVGAAISNLATYPLSLIVARLQAQRLLLSKQRTKIQESEEKDHPAPDADSGPSEEYANIFDAARKIYDDEGFDGLYSGLSQDTGKTFADSFLFFLAYTFFRERRIKARFGASSKRRRNVVLPVLDELVIGILAGAFGKLFTTPLSNIVTRKQTSAVAQKGSSSSSEDRRAKTACVSTKEIAAQILSEKGLRGLWSGYSAALILTLNPSITLFLNELLKRALLRIRAKAKCEEPSAAVTFLLAAISKAAASSITYPFSLAKTRAQVNNEREDRSRNKTTSNLNTTSPSTDDSSDEFSFPTPQIISTVLNIARTEGPSALYAGLSGEILKGFFTHGFTILVKDAVYSVIVQTYYAVLILLRRYPTPEELVQRAREQVEEYAEVARDGARELVAVQAKEHTPDGMILKVNAGSITTDLTSANAPAQGVEVEQSSSSSPEALRRYAALWSDSNETAELVGDYVEDEADEWRSLYHWFWEKDRGKV